MKNAGVRLVLRDQMSSNLKKAAKAQKDFKKASEQAKRSVNSMGTSTNSGMSKASNAVTRHVSKITKSFKKIAKPVISPLLKVKDKITPKVTQIKGKLSQMAHRVTAPLVKLKDMASKKLAVVGTKLKAMGKMVATPLIKVKDAATKILGGIGSKLASLAKGVVIGVSVAGVAGIAKSLKEGADYQQNVGGIETLFGTNGAQNVQEYAKLVGGSVKQVQAEYNKLKSSESQMLKYANDAWATAGLSANQYMEQSTSFAAALLKSTGGDTMKAANAANQAVIDMADNSNKMGTNMEDIQNAYQGFAKQNYTMLDNLKLGYGGTKGEMERLLKDANQLTGVKYDINNLSDVYSAIHAVQDNLHITGTTAKEAQNTFSGSFNMMKASASNFMAVLSTGGNVKKAVENLVSSAGTFLKNAIPMIGNIFKALPGAIGKAVKDGLPMIRKMGGDIVNSLKSGIVNLAPNSVRGALSGMFANLGNVSGQLIPMIQQYVTSFKSAFTGMLPVLANVVNTVISLLPTMMGVINTCFGTIVQVLNSVLPVVNSFLPVVSMAIQSIGQIVQAVLPVIGSIISTVVVGLTPLLQTIFSLVQQALPIITMAFTTMAGIIQSLVPVIGSIIQAIVPPVQVILEALHPVISLIGQVVEAVLPIVAARVRMVGSIVQAVMPIVGALFRQVANVISVAISAITAVISGLVSFLTPAFSKIKSILTTLKNAFSSAFNAIGSVVSSVCGGIRGAIDTAKSVLDGLVSKVESVKSAVSTVRGMIPGFAYGKDRVPYNNYPAMLHQGERVLTRVQADQYDRVMSSESGGSVGGAQSAQPVGVGGGSTSITLNMPKLAESLVVRSDSDIDAIGAMFAQQLEMVAMNWTPA